ncbi:MAG: hypothetical protein WC747_00160 [Candidatus Babeliales bacterium]|jgi:hypothetical protein
MEILKKIALSAIIGLCAASFIQPSEQIYNFRWYLMNVLEQHCQHLSGSSKKIGAKNPCLISLDPLIQTSLLGNILVGDDLVKKKQFVRSCQKHMTTQQGKSKLSEYDVRHYCKQSYTHFKQAHDKYERGPKLGYVIK